MYKQVRAPRLASWALANGRGALTTAEVAELLGVDPDQVRHRLNPPMRRGEWVQPARGLWIPVPPEYQAWGAPPGIEVVELMMRHLNVDYYVGWLTAAALYGAAHQAPQVFQVGVDRQVRDRVVGRTQFSFALRHVAEVPVTTHHARYGSARVSTLAATMLDVANDLQRSSGIDNAATVIVELSEHEAFNAEDLAVLAPSFPASAGRRVGWILSRFAGRSDLGALQQTVRDAIPTPSVLYPHAAGIGTIDPEWRVCVNRDLEPEA